MGKGESPSRVCASVVSFARIHNQNLRVESRLSCRSKGLHGTHLKGGTLRCTHVLSLIRQIASSRHEVTFTGDAIPSVARLWYWATNYPSVRLRRFDDNQPDNSPDRQGFSSKSFTFWHRTMILKSCSKKNICFFTVSFHVKAIVEKINHVYRNISYFYVHYLHYPSIALFLFFLNKLRWM